MSGFSVDPRIFHELGALLVKRDSIALTELIKNAYDADAQRVRILGKDLDSPEGTIIVADDGIGMTAKQFREGFLRIASRSKETGTRRSEIFGRRFTGEKGIGRLSAHKLGAVLGIRTVALRDLDAWAGTRQVVARVDWDEVERQTALNDLPDSALTVRSSTRAPRPAGTRLEISRIRRPWSDAELRRFIAEADLFEPPSVLLEPVTDVTAAPLLFKRLAIRDAPSTADSFEVELQGDFRVGEQLWQQVPEAAWWILEIASKANRVVFKMQPTKLGVDQRANLVGDAIEFERRDSKRPRFQARIFVREGPRSARDRAFTTQVSGIRVYMEGFRISPYGERGDDWLHLDRDYAMRTDRLGLNLPDLGTAAGVDREGLRTLPNRSYAGVVLLTHEGAPELEAPVDREGFLDSPQLGSLRETVRLGLDLLTRHRARLGMAEQASRDGPSAPHIILADEVVVRDGLAEAVDHAKAVRRQLAAARVPTEEMDEMADSLVELSRIADRAVTDRAMLRILAAAGTQMAVFVHEIENIISSVASIRRQLRKLAKDFPDSASRLEGVNVNLARIEERVVAQAGYLSDVAAATSRTRRRRIRLSEAVERAWHLVSSAADRLNVELDTAIDDRTRTPSMFPAELSAILSNLLTNALKAAGEGGVVRVSDGRAEHGAVLRVQNTGTRVALGEAERWFLPFESTSTARVDPLLGQGMGLGLPIVRSILSDYASTISFTPPDPDMATSVEVQFR